MQVPCLTTIWAVWQSTHIWEGKGPNWSSDPRRQSWAECGLGMPSAQVAALWSLAPCVYISWMWFVNKDCHRLCWAEAKVILAWGLGWVRFQQSTWRPPRLARLSENLNQRAAGKKWVWEKAWSPSKKKKKEEVEVDPSIQCQGTEVFLISMKTLFSHMLEKDRGPVSIDCHLC